MATIASARIPYHPKKWYVNPQMAVSVMMVNAMSAYSVNFLIAD